MCCVCKSYVVFAQCTASIVCREGLRQVLLLLFYFVIFCTTASAVCCACKSHIVFALLPARCAVYVSPELCLLNVLPAQFAVRGLQQVLLLLLFYFAFLHYCQHSVLYVQVLCCVCTTASTVCCVCKSCVVFVLLPAQCAVCKSCVVFALLPAQCAVSVSPVLCLINVLPAQFAVWGLRQVLLLLFNFAYCLLFYSFPLVGSG